MKEIICTTQNELDKVDINFDGIIKICGINIIIKLRYKYRVEAWGNSSVVARGNSSVVAWENSSVEAWENSSVVARGTSSVRIFSSIKKLLCYGFSVVIKPFDLKFKFKKEKCAD